MMSWVVLLLALFGACVSVRPYQREKLAKPKMQLSGDPQGNQMTQHVYESREGAAGGTGAGGGGCGCN